MAGQSETTVSSESLKSSSARSRKPSYWAHMVSHYEKRNASLEQRQLELAERIRLMECAVPSLLMGAMVSMKRSADPSSKLSSSPRTNEQTSTYKHNGPDPEGKLQNSRSNEPGELRRANGRSELSRFCKKNTDFRP